MLKGGQEELGPNLDMTLTAARAGKAKDQASPSITRPGSGLPLPRLGRPGELPSGSGAQLRTP